MRKLIGIIALVSFAALAVFGFLGMNMADMSGHADCIATSVNGGACPITGNPIDYAGFHISAFLSFSTAYVVTIVLALAAVFIFIALQFGLPLDLAPPRALAAIYNAQSAPTFWRPFRRWLAQLEKRDPRF